MFFLLRMTFWLGIVLVLLPTDKAPDDKNVPQIGAAQAVTAAGAAVSDLSQFCTRQPETCEIGGQAMTVIGHRAQAGARKVYEMIVEKKNDSTGSIASGDAAPPDTLGENDVKVPWRGALPEKHAEARATH